MQKTRFQESSDWKVMWNVTRNVELIVKFKVTDSVSDLDLEF